MSRNPASLMRRSRPYVVEERAGEQLALRQRLELLERMVTASLLEVEAATRKLQYLATHDALTDLPNRTLLEARIAEAMLHAGRTGGIFALAVLDLDRFKVVTESLGHRAGDELLTTVARRIVGVLREHDTVARVGADQFAVLIGRIHAPAEAMRIAHRIMLALQPPVRIHNAEVHAAASIGIACFPADGSTMDALCAHADVARCVARRRGRSTISCFEPDMDVRAPDLMKLEGDLHRALREGQFELHYQPKVDMASGQIRGAEALLRWRHPERGLVPPGGFIPLAEECGLIIPIGDWVIREACRQLKAWQAAGLSTMRVAVNVSAVQLRQHDLVDTVRRALADTGVAARFLEIELTESAVMTNPEESVATLQNLSRMGVTVSVDDFGTGYSCMSHLRRFPLDKLKIDRSFVTDLIASPEAAAVVRGIISLAHSLRLKVIAEGVETREQIELLKILGCDQYQGFYFSPPIAAAAYQQLLTENQQTRRGARKGDFSETCSRLLVLAGVGVPPGDADEWGTD